VFGGLDAGRKGYERDAMETQEARYQATLLGLAVGAAVEFESPGTFRPVTDMVGGGPHRLRPGEWTDDTSMALCLAASLVECDGFDPADQMRCYLRWRDEGYMASNGRCFDIGSTIARALRPPPCTASSPGRFTASPPSRLHGWNGWRGAT
jgi:ADP-ribosylglycohydrolase